MTNNKNPKISIIMVDGSFRESFHSIDFFCTQTLPVTDFELIWVEYYFSVKPELQAQLDKYPNARVITLGLTGVYHSSCCFNAGIQSARGELLIIPDADVVVEPYFLETVWQEHQTNDKLALYLQRYNESKENHVEPITLEHLQQVTTLTTWGNFGGCLTIRKKWLIEINGYEQHPVFSTGLHANGVDINVRLVNLGLHIMWHPTLKLFHPWHKYTTQENTSYYRQGIMTQYRRLNLVTQAYQGINATRNLPFPDDLQMQLQDFDAEKRKENVPKHIGLRSILKMGSRKLKNRLKSFKNLIGITSETQSDAWEQIKSEPFDNTIRYWEKHYQRGIGSGSGSYGMIAQYKASIINQIIKDYMIETAIEFGCGDGNQLTMINYPYYIGLDVSKTAVEMCRKRFASDPTKRFYVYTPYNFAVTDETSAELALSLEVIFHLVEDEIYELHMKHLFEAARKYVVIFSSDGKPGHNLPESFFVKQRYFTNWVTQNQPSWKLIQKFDNPHHLESDSPIKSMSNFYIYEKQ